MKKLYVTLFFVAALFTAASAQSYNNIVNYNLNGTPVNGLKIVTTLPFTTGTQMPTVIIQGYNYSQAAPIGLILTWYIYPVSGVSSFVDYAVSSFGAYTPQISLSNENGFVVIFINDKPYYPRFTLSAFAKGMPDDQSQYYAGWTVADAALTGTNTVTVPYKNNFGGTVTLPGTGIWNSSGNVGIGTTNPGAYRLAVNGNVHAKQVNVDLNGWSDYVFKKGYRLPDLSLVKAYIAQNGHLPGIPSGAQITKNGLNIGDMDNMLMKKVEELTLYIIDADKKLAAEKKKNAELGERVRRLEAEMQLVLKSKS